MGLVEFESIKNSFSSASVEDKIDIYINTENLTKEQYKELLKLYPISELGKLEEALK